MEERVGAVWHHLISRAASREYPAAAVELAPLARRLAVQFRAMGGDPGLRVVAASEATHGSRRGWLQRLAGTGARGAAASRDGETLCLPPRLALFSERELNHELYLWLTALAAAHERLARNWLLANQQATRAVLNRYPGLRARYARLVEAAIALRIEPGRLPADEAAAESAIRRALREPGQVLALPAARRAPQPMPLWLVPPAGSGPTNSAAAPTVAPDASSGRVEQADDRRRRARRVKPAQRQDGMLFMFRAESIFSWAEYVHVNRPHDDAPNENAARAADDFDELAITRGAERPASRVRFDLDLPSPAVDDLPLGPGLRVPEWDFRQRALRPDYCQIQPLTPRDAGPLPIPEHLRRPAARLRAQFSALAPARRWLKNQPDGSEIDLDAFVREYGDRMAGSARAASGGYLAQVRNEHDLACLVLADLSLSTDSHVSDEQRVIDVIRDAMLLFAEALTASGDPFAMFGFSSLKRTHVRLHAIKDFTEPYGDDIRGRISALKPGYYTRMGAAIRVAAGILAERDESLRLLLILSDGKPNDSDHYEGRYAIEDTRMSLCEARHAGLRPFCVTIDREAGAYLPHLFGPAGYTILRRPQDLPVRLPLLYAQLRNA